MVDYEFDYAWVVAIFSPSSVYIGLFVQPQHLVSLVIL